MSTEYMECVACHMVVPATQFCGNCSARQPKRRQQPAAYSPGGRAGNQGGWWVAGKPKGKGQGKGQYGKGQQGPYNGGSKGGKGGGKGGGKSGKAKPPPRFDHGQLNQAIAGIPAMSPAQARLHPYWDEPPANGIKAENDAYKAYWQGQLEDMKYRMASSRSMGMSLDEDIIYVAVIRAMLCATKPRATQIKEVTEAIERALKKDTELLKQQLDLEKARQSNDKSLQELQTTKAELLAEEVDEAQGEEDKNWEEGGQGHCDEEADAGETLPDARGEDPRYTNSQVCMHPTVAVSKAKGSCPEKTLAKPPPPPPPAAAGGPQPPPAKAQGIKAPQQVTAEDVNVMVQKAQELANEKMLQAVAAAVQQAMAAALATAAMPQPALQAQPAMASGTMAVTGQVQGPVLPEPMYEVPSRSPTRAPSRSLSTQRRIHHGPYDNEAAELRDTTMRDGLRRKLEGLGAKYVASDALKELDDAERDFIFHDPDNMDDNNFSRTGAAAQQAAADSAAARDIIY